MEVIPKINTPHEIVKGFSIQGSKAKLVTGRYMLQTFTPGYNKSTTLDK